MLLPKTPLSDAEIAEQLAAHAAATDPHGDRAFSSDASNLTDGTVAIARGGTGATTAATARVNLLAEQIKSSQILGGTFNTILGRQDTGGVCFTVGVFGDSYAVAPVDLMRRDYGSWGYISAVTAAFTRAGGAAMAATDFTKNINGQSCDLTSGQSIQLPPYYIGSRLVCVYQVSPSAGTFKIQYELNKTGGWIDALTVDATVSVNGSTSAAMAVSTQTAGTYRVRALGVSGSCRILALGIDFGNTTGNRHGVREVQANVGGSTIAQWNTTPQHIWNAYFAGADGVPPDLSFFKADDASAAFTTSFPGVVSKLQTAATNTKIIVQGRHPTTADPSNTTLHADDVGIGALCEANGWVYINTRLFFPTGSQSITDGILSGDNVHLTAIVGNGLQNLVTYNHLWPINSPLHFTANSGNGKNKAFLAGVLGTRAPQDAYSMEWTVGGPMDILAGRLGFTRLDAGTGINPGTFYGFLTTERIAGSATHKQGMGIILNDLSAMFFNSSRNAIIGGGPYAPASVSHPMTDAITILNGRNGQGGLNLSIETSPHSSTVPFQVRRDASITAIGTQVMRMHRLHPKFEYLGGDAASVTGTFTLVSGVATINTTAAATNDHINLQLVTPGGVMGLRYKVAIVNGTSFTITSVDASGATVTTDTSSGTWHIAAGRFTT